MLKKCVYALVIVSVLLTAAYAQNAPAAADKVTLKTGEEVVCKVLADDINGLNYRLVSDPSKTFTKGIDDVLSVKFFDTPASLLSAETERGSGNYLQALPLYESAISETKTDKAKKYRPFHMQYALNGRALTYVMLEKYPEAISSYRQLLADVPATKFKKDAYKNWLDCCVRMKSIPALQDFSAVLTKDASELAKTFAANVQITMAEMQFNNVTDGNYKDVQAAYKPLTTSTDPDISARAQIGEIRVFEATKDTSSLQMFIDELSGKKDLSPFLICIVNTFQGDAQLKKAMEKKDKAMYYDTLMYYLKAISVGFPAPGMDTYYQRALYNAAICYKTIAGLTTKVETADKYKKRARTLLEELTRSYPKTEFLEGAKKMIEEFKDVR